MRNGSSNVQQAPEVMAQQRYPHGTTASEIYLNNPSNRAASENREATGQRNGKPIRQISSPDDAMLWHQKLIVRQAESFVLKYLPDRLSEGFIARTFNVDGRTLRNAFWKVRGVAPYTAFRARRVEEVMRRLEDDPKLAIEIAMRQCGFGSFAGFRNEFKRKFGIDPKEIRKIKLGSIEIQSERMSPTCRVSDHA